MSRRQQQQEEADAAWWLKVAEIVVTGGIAAYGLYMTAKMVDRMSMLNEPTKEKERQSRAQLAQRLKRPELENMPLDQYEARIASEAVDASTLGVSFADIGGMSAELEEVRDNVVLPMKCWAQFGAKAGEMMSCPAGVLLYGRPGTGKTLTATALAAESGASFLNIKSADVMDKWMGESDKLVRAVFSLARKIAPTIVFIDEVDTLLRKRENDQNGTVASMQGVLLAEWDGLKTLNTSGTGGPVVLLGATNRPHDLDTAILRRMPVQVKMNMPGLEGRLDILHKLLAHSGVQKEESSAGLHEDVDLHNLALRTEAYSGSDLREVVRVALLQRTKRNLKAASREQQVAKAVYDRQMLAWQAKQHPSSSAASSEKQKEGGGGAPVMKTVLPVRTTVRLEDFDFALTKALPTGTAANDYARELGENRGRPW